MAITGISYQTQKNLNAGNNTPHGAAYIPSLSQIWIANNSDDDVYKYNENLAYQGKASLPSGFVQPRGLCWVESRSELWGVDTGQNRIYRMNTALASQGTYNLTSANTAPEGILSFDSIGEVWVANNSPNRIYRYNASDGSFIAYFDIDNQIGDPRGGTFQPESNEAWILDQSDKIGRYNAARAFQGTYSLNSAHTFPRSCVSAGSKIWVIDNGIDKAFSYDILTDAVSIPAIPTQQWTENIPITTTMLPAATGGNGIYTYALSDIPSGLSFDATTRLISGASIVSGDFILNYTATDSWGKSASKAIHAIIDADNDADNDIILLSADVIAINRDTGKWIDNETESIKQNIGVIIGTQQGTRVMVRDFGSNLRRYLGAPMNVGTLTQIYADISEAIRKWENRVSLKQVQVVKVEAGAIHLRLTLAIDGVISNYEYSFV